MVEFTKSKEEFLKTFLELPNGIPSEDTISRLFSSIDSEQFELYFIQWVNSISDLNKGQIAIDGKTISRREFKNSNKEIEKSIRYYISSAHENA